jgi:hypothetical protein
MHPGAAVNRVTLLRSVAQAKRRSPATAASTVSGLRLPAFVGRCCQRHQELPFVAACLGGMNLGQQLRQCGIPPTTHCTL